MAGRVLRVHLVGGVIHPDQERRSMVVPRRWDGMFASRIFKLEAGERPTEQQMEAISQLYKQEGPLEFADEVEAGRAEGAAFLGHRIWLAGRTGSPTPP
ncbi:hypothetical protein [Streptomyces noursei]|uniref:hypothetical protein n=1 Tax=Streptomyces noursei TaxID=1971 RepID=UPI0021A6FD65|nr:hypothetical protein [Streptomyces noursei]UWS69809.1 hypothetical protein N1H47_00010 [Streptomyces noursei]UWS76970.1 hypothetical protein N1H47_40510 [Streptomyces noursei]